MSVNMDDREFFLGVLSEVCSNCRHSILGGHTCAAFPGGIPDEIWKGENDHTKPWPGDGGIQFAPIEKDETP